MAIKPGKPEASREFSRGVCDARDYPSRMIFRNPRTAAGLMLALIAAFSARAQTDIQITGLAQTTNGWSLQWQHSAPDTAYTVQYQDTLDDVIWRVAPSAFTLPTTSNQWVDVSVESPTRFYRVVGVPAPERGKLISATLTRTVSTIELTVLFNFAGIPITPQYSVRMYKVVYETVTPLGGRTLASGALMLPQGVGSPLPLVSYQHGTITQTNAAPSSMDPAGEAGIGLVLATTGYAAALPDYLGLGESPGLHPYHHARSQATACLDMLRATKTFCATNGFPLNDKLFLAGYSQGGHATMALCRELETYHTNQFTITACAPMAGAHDLSGVTTADFLSGRAQPNPYYFAYLLAAYQEVYRLAPTFEELLAPPYDTTLPPLLKGNSSGGQINSAMPSNPIEILKPEYLAAFRDNPRHPLRLALEENDLHRWKPRAPMRLYHCAGDQDVIVANSQVAHASFHALGATQVELIDPDPEANHGGCAEPSFLLVKAWFDSLK